MTTIKQFLILTVAFFIIESARAADEKFTVEPLYGIETSLVRFPEPARYVTRALYGARALYGTTFLSAEGEFTTAKSQNSYPSTDTKVEDTVERLGLGIRSTLPMNQFLAVYFRAGGRASQGETIVTTAGVSDTKENPLRVDPYAGAGVQLGLNSLMGLSFGATMFRNAEGKYDAQYTLSLSARFGKL